MVLSTAVRKQKLSEIRSSSESQGREKLYYMNERQSFEVHRIDLDYLIYNRHNGRIEAEMLTWEQENTASHEVYDEELHKKIENFLWESNKGRNKATLKDITTKGQLKTGIVSLDGVIIDGNRRAMLLRRLEEKGKPKEKQYFDAIILPHSFADNQAEIVRLETQYQIGEDSKVEYGPLQKYLHARRLRYDLGIEPDEIDALMGANPGNAQMLLRIMELMDEYLEHIQCPRLYLLLKDADGTKEGMFVDLYRDLKRLESGNAKIPWNYDSELDVLQLKLIHFDFIRFGQYTSNKAYREISFNSAGKKTFFANKEIWEKFSASHGTNVDPITQKMGDLRSFIEAGSGSYETKLDAARARDKQWCDKVDSHLKSSFGQASWKLGLLNEGSKPGELLRKARDLMEKIDLDSDGLLSPENEDLTMEINRMSYAIKQRFKKSKS